MSDKPRFPSGGPCRHFNGIQNDACKAGVAFDTLARPVASGVEWSRLPCIRADGKTWCERHNPFTPDEMRAQEIRMTAETRHILDAVNCIAESKETTGSITCPKCLGVLRFTRASNGHVRGRCETAGCMAFMS